jgi:hypothetical protein
MPNSRMAVDLSQCGAFAEKVAIELNRAERYRVFVSLTVFDLGAVCEVAGEKTTVLLHDLSDRVKELVRACDHVELLNASCLAVLQPETPRQGAEISAKRLTAVVKSRLIEELGREADRVIPVEIASYPDTAGARTLTGFLQELTQKNQN